MRGAICEKQYVSPVNSESGSKHKNLAGIGVGSNMVAFSGHFYGEDNGMLSGGYSKVVVNAMGGISELDREFHIASIIASCSWKLPEMIQEIISCNPEFAQLNKTDLNKKLVMLISKAPHGVLSALEKDREELKRRIKSIMMIESMVSAFTELSPNQIKRFDDIIRD